MGEILEFRKKHKREYKSPQQRLLELLHVGAEQSEYVLAHGSSEPVIVLTLSQVRELIKIFRER